MKTEDDRCAHVWGDGDKCGLWRDSHRNSRFAPGYAHAFVEPAPQPPADAASDQLRNCPKTGRQCMCVDVRSDCEPAAPPVSGDEAVVRETTHQYLQGPWPSDACAEAATDGALCMLTNAEHRFEPLTLREKQAYAAGLERGRALGARDVERILHESCDCAAAPERSLKCSACRAADAIARRSGGQGK
jgi:hypothetical protein